MESGDSCTYPYLEIEQMKSFTRVHWLHVKLNQKNSSRTSLLRTCPLFSPVCVDVTVTFNPQNYTVTEGDPAPLMIILDKPAAKDITVTVTTMDITAEGEKVCNNWLLCTHPWLLSVHLIVNGCQTSDMFWMVEASLQMVVIIFISITSRPIYINYNASVYKHLDL